MKKQIHISLILISILSLVIFSGCESKKTQKQPVDEIGILNLEFDAFAKLQRQNNDILAVNERNVLIFQCDSLGQCYYQSMPISLKDMQLLIYKTMTIQIDSIGYPKLITQSFKHSGSVKYAEMFYVFFKFDSALPYKTYFQIRTLVQNIYIKVRNDFAQSRFEKSIYQLIHSQDPSDQERWNEIRQIYPIHYLENLK